MWLRREASPDRCGVFFFFWLGLPFRVATFLALYSERVENPFPHKLLIRSLVSLPANEW